MRSTDDSRFRFCLLAISIFIWVFLFHANESSAAKNTDSTSIATSISSRTSPEVNEKSYQAPVNNEQGASSAGDDLVKFLDLILKAINIYLIFHIFSVGRLEKKAESVRAVDSFWYQELVLKGGMPHINKFFESISRNCEQHISEIREGVKSNISCSDYDLLVKASHRTFNDSKRELRKEFFDIVEAIDCDFAAELNTLLNEFQERFGKVIAVKLEDFSEDKISSECASFKPDLLKKLFSYHNTSAVKQRLI